MLIVYLSEEQKMKYSSTPNEQVNAALGKLNEELPGVFLAEVNKEHWSYTLFTKVEDDGYTQVAFPGNNAESCESFIIYLNGILAGIRITSILKK